LVISVAIPITSSKGVSMLTVNKQIASRFSPGAEKAILARGKRDDGVSVEFPNDLPDDLVDSHPGGKEKDFVDARDRDRSDRADGERDVEARDEGDGDKLAADAQMHMLAKDHDEEEAVKAGGGEGEECKIDHEARAHELLGEHLRRRGMNASKVSFRFQR
jgi:hypothetical protein